MAQQLELKFKGLYTHPNQFSEVPDGALTVADNVVIDRESIVSTRRGYMRYGTSLGTTDIKALFQFDGVLIAHTSDNKLYYDDGSGNWTQLTGTYTAPDTLAGSRIRSIESNKNVYFTSADGVYKMSTLLQTPRLAGAPKALGGVASLTGASGFMSPSVNVAYRIVWGYKDLNKNLILGVPSERIIVSNTSTTATANVSITFQIPPGIDTTWFYQVYRSTQSASVSDSPNDEMQQVYENNPSSAENTAREITIVDNTPNDLRQATLYTSPSREGIANANYAPPFCRDVAEYKNLTLYANTRSIHRYFNTLVSAGGTSGLQVGDTVHFDDGTHSFTLTGAAAENAATGAFLIATAGTPAQNIEATARSMVAIANKYAGNTMLNAYYMSDFDQLPGQMMFEKRDISASAFAVTSTRGGCWNPRLPTSGTAEESTNDVSANRIFVSKFQQPESVPLLNYIDVGSANSPIRRILALRDGIIILKDEGVWRISGRTFAQFNLELLDNTVRILAENSAVVLANQVFFLSDQGVVAASDTGVAVFSRPIEKTLIELTSPSQFPNFSELAFAVAYNSDRKYILYLPSAPSDTACTQAYVYNTFTNTWTRWTKTFTCGLLNEVDNKLYMGTLNQSSVGGYVYKERKDFTINDYTDENYTVSITGFSNDIVTITSPTPLQVGDNVRQTSAGANAAVSEVIDATNYRMDQTLTWDIGSADAFTAIDSSITTVQQDCGNPGIFKHIREASFIFQEIDFQSINATFTSDLSQIEYPVTVISLARGTFGNFPWGQTPWGGGQAAQARLRTLVPQPVQRANWLIIKVQNKHAFTTFGLAGISLMFEQMSERQK